MDRLKTRGREMRFSSVRKMTSLASVLAAAVVMFHGSLASAQTFTLDTSFISGMCGGSSTPCSGNFGTVTLTQNSPNQAGVSLQLNSGENFVSTGAADAMLFNLVGNPTLTVSPYSITGLDSTFSFTASPSAAGGTGTWDYGIVCSTCSAGNSSGSTNPTSISFDINDSSGISTSSFVSSVLNGNNPGPGYLFGSDIFVDGYTGPVASSGTSIAAPEIDPASAASGLVLLIGGLVVLRGRKQQLIAA